MPPPVNEAFYWLLLLFVRVLAVIKVLRRSIDPRNTRVYPLSMNSPACLPLFSSLVQVVRRRTASFLHLVSSTVIVFVVLFLLLLAEHHLIQGRYRASSGDI